MTANHDIRALLLDAPGGNTRRRIMVFNRRTKDWTTLDYPPGLPWKRGPMRPWAAHQLGTTPDDVDFSPIVSRALAP